MSKNLPALGMTVGIVGGGVCALAGLLSLLLGMVAASQQFGSTIPPGMYWILGFYFIGKGGFAAGLSLTTGAPKHQTQTSASK